MSMSVLTKTERQVCVCAYVCVMVMLTQTGSSLSVMRSLRHFLPAVGLYTHTNKPRDVDTDTYTAGLPVTGDLGYALGALYVFHIHSSPPPLPSELTPSSSLSFILSLPSSLLFFPLHVPYFFPSFSLPQTGVSSFHLSQPFQSSDVSECRKPT